MNIVQADIIEAIASQLALALTEMPGIPLGEGEASPRIIQLSHADRDYQIILRTDNGEAWVVRCNQLGNDVTHRGAFDKQVVQASYKRYLDMTKQSEVVVKVAKSCGADEDMALQAYYDEVLSDLDRQDWDRWVSGGYASDAEWAIVNTDRRTDA